MKLWLAAVPMRLQYQTQPDRAPLLLFLESPSGVSLQEHLSAPVVVAFRTVLPRTKGTRTERIREIWRPWASTGPETRRFWESNRELAAQNNNSAPTSTVQYLYLASDTGTRRARVAERDRDGTSTSTATAILVFQQNRHLDCGLRIVDCGLWTVKYSGVSLL